jgi:hypothetical protein
MKILSEKQVLVLKIEYELGENDERSDVFDWLDKTYGELNWRSCRSGPAEGGKGLIIAKVSEGEAT